MSRKNKIYVSISDDTYRKVCGYAQKRGLKVVEATWRLLAIGFQYDVWGDPAKGDPMRAKIPLGRFGRPVEVADLILFLASPASDLICGETILIDGGYTVI